jgi:hypothetical protein
VLMSLSDQDVDRVELDSPGALGIALKVARMLELGDVTIHAHTNSLRLLRAVIAQDSTSHFVASFAPGIVRQSARSTLLFIGDMMLDRTVKTRMISAKDPLYPFLRIRDEENRFFHGQDVVVGNLEGPVTATRRPPEKSIDFAFDPSVAAALQSLGFDAVSQANNHALDQGRDGAAESRALLQAAGLTVFGDEIRDDVTSSLAIVERRGTKIALLGFNTTNNPLDEDDALDAIREAKQKATVVIVYMHWGEEYQAKPNASQVERAHWFIDHGVDAVIGAHPHWMQSVEVYNGRPIAYSLGNFIFDQDWSIETNLGLVVGLVLDGEGANLAFALYLFPIQIEASRPRIMTGDERAARLEYLATISDPALKEQILNGVITGFPPKFTPSEIEGRE